MTDERDIQAPLSGAGIARRDRMRGELLRAQARVHQARRMRRRGLGAAALLVIAGSVYTLAVRAPSPPAGSAPTIAGSDPEPAPGAEAGGRITIVRTDPGVLDRYSVRAAPARVTYISDAELVQDLASLGESAAVVRLPDRVLLVLAEGSERAW